MANINQIKQIIAEINGEAEKTRRTAYLKRHRIYKDGGRSFLIEQLRREFGPESIPEMRLCPINLLKKICDKKAGLFKKAPSRYAQLPSDQALIDFYVNELKLNDVMLKWDRYLELFSNAPAYVMPKQNGKLCLYILPAYNYSVAPDEFDQTKAKYWILNSFVEEGEVNPDSDLPSATGVQSYNRILQNKSAGDQVDSNEHPEIKRNYIFWSDEEHFLCDSEGNPIIPQGIDPSIATLNPLGVAPFVNLTKDRDNEFWAMYGDDMIDLTMALQLGFSDLLTISKQQGWGQMVIKSIEEPKNSVIGLNKIVWLKQQPDSGLPQPEMQYVQNNPPIEEYKNLLLDILGLLLSTNSLDPKSIGGTLSGRDFTSGFHALISMSDTLEDIQAKQSKFATAESELWQVIAKYHNYLYENGALDEDAAALGMFSQDLEVNIVFPSIRPMESNKEKLDDIERMLALGLITKIDAIKMLNPEMTDDQIDTKMKEISIERSGQIDNIIGRDINAKDSMTKEDEDINGESQGEV
jgi:hypothetical protein